MQSDMLQGNCKGKVSYCKMFYFCILGTRFVSILKIQQKSFMFKLFIVCYHCVAVGSCTSMLTYLMDVVVASCVACFCSMDPSHSQEECSHFSSMFLLNVCEYFCVYFCIIIKYFFCLHSTSSDYKITL